MNEKHVLLIQIYTELLPAIRDTAKQHGYAIGVHGSLRRDFDLIAVPWADEVSDELTLLYAIMDTMKLNKSWKEHAQNTPEKKPQGRTAYQIMLGDGMYIDLSILSTKDNA